MTTTDNTTKRKRGRPAFDNSPDLGPQVRKKLDAARADFDASEQPYQDAVLAEAIGVPGADEKLAEIRAERERLASRVTELEVALGAAEQADRRKWAQRRAAIWHGQTKTIKKHLDARAEAAKRLSVAIENAAKAWHDLVMEGRAARSKSPPGFIWPHGSKVEDAPLQLIVGHELWRRGCKNPVDYVSNPDKLPNFPSPRPASGISYHPNACVPLLDEIEKANQFIVDALEGKIDNYEQHQMAILREGGGSVAASPSSHRRPPVDPAFELRRADRPADRDIGAEKWNAQHGDPAPAAEQPVNKPTPAEIDAETREIKGSGSMTIKNPHPPGSEAAREWAEAAADMFQ